MAVLTDLDVVYDNKAYGNIIDPTQWNANFKIIEEVVNENNDEIESHFANTENPHTVTKTQVDLGNVDNVQQATKSEFNEFVARTDNPHGVTSEQIGATALKEAGATTVQGVLEELKDVDNHVNGSVNKVFTATEKTKLGTVDENANNYSHPDTHPASMITGLSASGVGAVANVNGVVEGTLTVNPSYYSDPYIELKAREYDSAIFKATSGGIFITSDGDYVTNEVELRLDPYSSPADALQLEITKKSTGVRTYGTIYSTHNPPPTVNNLTEAVAGKALDATQGKVLAEQISTISGVKTARFVVGTSVSGWTAADCDYLCDGTADQTEINAAITALPATGGEIVILDGTYNITARIDVTKDNVSIRGNGNTTILKRMYNSTAIEGVITLTSRSDCKIADLQVDGNKGSYTNSNNYGIYLSSSSNNTVTGNACNDNSNFGIYLSSSSNNTVAGNTCNNNYSGIYLSSSSNSTIAGNTCNNNPIGICLGYSSNDNLVTGNTCNNNYSGIYLDSSSNDTVTGNTCNNNYSGIYLDSSSNSTIAGNTCNNNPIGICLGYSSNNTITGNTCIRGTGLTTDYTGGQYTIFLEETDNNYNLISNNNCMGKAVTNEGGTGNSVYGNKYDSGDYKDFTQDEKTKLAGIANNANNYVHPTGDGNLHVPATGTTNSGKVLTAGATAGSLSWTTPTGGSSVSGKRTVRFVIGTSTAGWTATDCDYFCDGTDDQVEINNAITALPATGGEIVILDGTYNITARIDVTKDNVSIRGNGNATILKRMFNSSTAEGVITLTGRSGCKIADLQVDGNKTSYTNNNNYGIQLTSSSNNTVTGNTCNNNKLIGIYLSSSSSNNAVTSNTCNNNYAGIYLDSSSNNTVTGNTCNNNSSSGIYLRSSSSNNAVTSNTCNNNSSYGIYLYSSSSNNAVTSNTCNNNNYGIQLTSSSNNNTITGNTCNSNSYGIYLVSSSSNTVTGNTCNNNITGIYLDGSSNNTITGNTCIRGTGLSTDYTASQHTIRLNGTSNSYNLIAMNNCMGKAVTNEGGTGNTLVNNKFDAA